MGFHVWLLDGDTSQSYFKIETQKYLNIFDLKSFVSLSYIKNALFKLNF